MEDAQKKEDAFSFDAWKEEDTLKENASSFFRSSSFSWWKEEGALEEGVLLRRVEEEDAPKENAFSFRDASASEEDATSSGASKQDAAPKEEDVSSSSGASKENNAYASTEENASSSFGESKRRTFRRRRTRPPSPRQSGHVNGERRVRLEGGGHVLLLWRVKEEHAPKEEDTPSSFSLSKKDDVCGIGQRLPVLFVLLPRPACSNAPDSRHVLTLRRNPQFLAFGLRISEAKSRPVHGRARDGGRLVGGLVPEAGNSNGPAGVNYRG